MSLYRPTLLTSDVSSFKGTYALATTTGAVTTVAAGTTTAGFLFSMRYAGTGKVLLRYLGAQFATTTAFTSAQEVGCEAFIARSYSASPTGGTALDLGATVTNTNKLLTATSTSDFSLASSDVRVATTGALTAGTQTLDANAFGSTSGWAGAVGITIAKTALFDGKTHMPPRPLAEERAVLGLSPVVLSNNEGIIIRNTVLMGAVGVGRWQFFVEWDEVAP